MRFAVNSHVYTTTLSLAKHVAVWISCSWALGSLKWRLGEAPPAVEALKGLNLVSHTQVAAPASLQIPTVCNERRIDDARGIHVSFRKSGSFYFLEEQVRLAIEVDTCCIPPRRLLARIRAPSKGIIEGLLA